MYRERERQRERERERERDNKNASLEYKLNSIQCSACVQCSVFRNFVLLLVLVCNWNICILEQN